MKSISKCHTVQKKSDSTFTFFGFDESNISDEILSEGNIEKELIREPVSCEHIENSPMKRWLHVPSQDQKEKIFTFVYDNLNFKSNFDLKRDSSNGTTFTKGSSNLLKVPEKKPRLNSINWVLACESPIQKEIRGLLQQIVKKKRISNVNKTVFKASNNFAESLVSMREISCPSHCFKK